MASQETRCREYAKFKEYDVTEVFYDKALSGKLMNRLKMQEMLAYLKKQKEEHIVIIDDIYVIAN